MEENPREMLTVAQTAELLKLSPYTVRQMVRDGRLVGEKLGYKTVRIYRAAIDSARKKTAPQSLIVKESTMTDLYAYAADLDESPDTLADELLSDALLDLRETVEAIRKSVEDASAGSIIDLEDLAAECRKKRESRSADLTPVSCPRLFANTQSDSHNPLQTT